MGGSNGRREADAGGVRGRTQAGGPNRARTATPDIVGRRIPGKADVSRASSAGTPARARLRIPEESGRAISVEAASPSGRWAVLLTCTRLSRRRMSRWCPKRHRRPHPRPTPRPACRLEFRVKPAASLPGRRSPQSWEEVAAPITPPLAPPTVTPPSPPHEVSYPPLTEPPLTSRHYRAAGRRTALRARRTRARCLGTDTAVWPADDDVGSADTSDREGARRRGRHRGGRGGRDRRRPERGQITDLPILGG